MRKFLSFCLIPALLVLLVAAPGMAQTFSALARVTPGENGFSDLRKGRVQFDLHLSQGVPYRVFTLTDPLRLVLDFKEVDWAGVDADALAGSTQIGRVRVGGYVPGWSRLVAELSAPLAVETAGLTLNAETAAAHLRLQLEPATQDAFADAAGVPQGRGWDLPDAALPAPGRDTTGAARLHVVLDPGHGGIDPGAEQPGLTEKDLMLRFARELREVLLRSGGYEVTLTRDGDHFVSLERRIAVAHQVGADVFISLHADSLSEGAAHGATVYTLSDEASDAASAKLAERHDRSQLLAGVDLSAADDEITDVLLDLARNETRPRTEDLSQALVAGMAQTGGPMNRRPLRAAGFSVLKAADIPSVLIEIGFMSSPRDLDNLKDPNWRASMAQGIRNGLEDWRRIDAARRPLVRQ